jgi:hypothetical protein
MSSVMYPTGYGTTMVNIDELFRRHHLSKMHPEYARRLRAWLISKGGSIGIGGSWRATQPVKPGFAPPGKSFHESQQFKSGLWFCAVDLVHVNPGKAHRSPTWNEVPKQGSADAKLWGLHCNVTKPSEPWHLQPVEIDGHGGWIKAGRPEPVPNYPIPGVSPTLPPLPTPDPGPAVVYAYPGTPLTLGSKGDAVKHIQRVVGATQDGDFGSVTEKRVKAWQTANNLLADGVVGVVTWKKMFG